MNADYIELQGLIDDARNSYTGEVIINRNYVIDHPLIVRGENQVSLTIKGYATMWDTGRRSVITATFKDQPILSIQRGKGCIISGINFQGAGSDGTDERTNVYAAIAIDPFNDGSRSGSTGIIIEHCTFNKVVAGVTTSINGYTQNAELITIQNCRSYNVKYFLIGTQAQEKMNRVINVGIWGPTHTAFMFNNYGAGTPGHWIIDGVNIAGKVDNLIYRRSGGYFPVVMSNVFAESLGSIGTWQSGVGDRLSNSSINFSYGIANHIDVEIVATSTQVLFYINGVLKATHTTNIPADLARLFGFGLGLKKKLGTGERYMDVDKMLFKIDE